MKKLPEELAIRLTIQIQEMIGQARLAELHEQKLAAISNIQEKDCQVQYVNETLSGTNIQEKDFRVPYVSENERVVNNTGLNEENFEVQYVNEGQIVIVSSNE